MAEESSNAMNLDLNIGPSSEPGLMPESAPDDDGWTIHRFVRDAARARHRAHQRWRQVTPLPHQNTYMDLNELMVDSSHGADLQAGEGSTAAEDRSNDVAKTCKNNICFLEDRDSDKKKNAAEKWVGDEGSFFDCNICLDLARDPVVTCCGHLFCWPCLYRWLHLHPHLKECPVCKGEVMMNNVTPIYGRGNNTSVVPEEDSGLEIPLRPHARRVEGLRQLIQRTAFDLPTQEMFRSIGSSPEVTNSLIERLLRSRAMIREQSPVHPPDIAVDPVQSGGEGGSHPLLSLVRRLQRVASIADRQNPVQPPDVAVDLAQSGDEGGSHHFLSLVRRSHRVASTAERQNPIHPPDVAAQSGGEGGSRLLRVRRLLHRVASTAERQNPIHPPHDAVDLSQSGGEGGSRLLRVRRLLHRVASTAERQNPIHPPDVDLSRSIGEDGTSRYRVRRLHRLAAAAERLAGRSQDQLPPVDDRDSFSSIAAVINSESQVDTAMEIDSPVSHSASTSRRGIDTSRALYLDTGNSRAARRRRLNPY